MEFRHGLSSVHEAAKDSLLSDEQMYERMRKGWRGGLQSGTVCGVGSTHANTENARAWLPMLVDRYDIRSVNDAGAGDQTWIRKVDWSVDYLGFDLIPRNDDVARWDITRDILPSADAILCRHVLNHLDDRVERTLQLFRYSGAKYLIATQFDEHEIDAREFMRLDLRKFLGPYLEAISDGGAPFCKLAIWKI